MTSEPRHIGVLQVCPQLLVDLLGLPKDTTVLGMRTDELGNFHIGLSGPSLPACEENEKPRRVELIYTRVEMPPEPASLVYTYARWAHDPPSTEWLVTRAAS